MRARVDVLFVCMPFGPLHQPSLGLSLLKAGLSGISSKVLYLTFDLAERLGVRLYDQIADGDSISTALEGEWLFSRGVYPRNAPADRRYLDEVLRRRHAPGPRGYDKRLLAARRHVVPFLDAATARILDHGPRIVAFTSVFQQQLATLGAARRVKEAAPATIILVGGANCEGVMGAELVRQFPWIDGAVSGEGDLIFPELAARLLRGEPVSGMPGLHTAAPQGRRPPGNAPRVERMDALPYPDFGDFVAQWRASPAVARQRPRLLMETARGCWWGERHHCTFCGLNGESMAFRSKSPQRVVEEIEHLASLGIASRVLMVDNIMDARYLRTLLPRLAAEGPKLDLFYEVKANLTREQVRLLRDAGIREIQPGIESLSDAVLRLMRKGVRGLHNVALLRWCKELHVTPYWNFLWGFPGEPVEEYARLAELVPLLHHLPPPDVGVPIRMDRFSPSFDQRDALGFAGVTPLPAYRHIYDVEAAALHNIAYFFTFSYRDGRDVAAYTAPLASAIARWKERHAASELAYVDRGDEMLVLDSRDVAASRVATLGGLDRKIVLACDAVRPRAALARDLAAEGDGAAVAGAIERLKERRLLLEDGGSLLALPVAAPPVS